MSDDLLPPKTCTSVPCPDFRDEVATVTATSLLDQLAARAYVTWCGDEYLNLFGAWDELREERRDLWRRIVSDVLRETSP